VIDTESSFLFPDIHSTVISRSLALALYGTTDAVGRELTLNEGWKFWVSAVFEDIPENSHIHFDILLTRASLRYYLRNFNNNTGLLEDDLSFEYTEPGPNDRRAWGNNSMYSYILIKEGTDLQNLKLKAETLLRDFKLPARFQNVTLKLIFQPVDEIHIRSDFPDEIKTTNSMFKISMQLLIGLIVLIISWINFIHLFVIDFHERSRDIALRMINGASRGSIFSQLFQKGLLISIIAGIITGAIGWLIVDVIFPASLVRVIDVVVLILLIIFSAFLALFIPFTGLGTGHTITLFKGEVFGKMRGTGRRRIFVLFQFTASTILITCTLVILLQMNYTRKSDPGFVRENIIYSYSPMTMNQRPDIPQKLVMFRGRLNSIPGVDEFCVSSSVPGKPYLLPPIIVQHQRGDKESENYLNRLHVDPWYIDTYNLKMLAGENFRHDHQVSGEEVLLNRNASRIMGFAEPDQAIGEFIRFNDRQYHIIGVIEDYHHLSFKSELAPVILFKSLQWMYAVGFYSVKLSSWDQECIDQVGEAWRDVYPGEKYIYKSLESAYMEQYAGERAFSFSFLISAVLAILISCLGLVGLSKYNTMKRTREIGIRKTFGAGTPKIMELLLSETVVLVLVSSFVGIPAAWFIMKKWLERFAYRIDLAWWMFVIAGIITIFIAMITVIVFTLKAARANPVKTLRYE